MVKYVTVQEQIMDTRVRNIGGGLTQTYQVPSGRYRDVQKKRSVFENVQGQLVSYQGTDVTIDVTGQGYHAFKYGNMSKADSKFLQEYRKLEQE